MVHHYSIDLKKSAVKYIINKFSDYNITTMVRKSIIR